MKIGLTQQDIARVEDLFTFVALAISMITVVGILCGLAVLCAARCCNKACGGCWTKWYVFWSAVAFLVISILFFIFGSALIVIKDQLSEEFIDRECKNALSRKLGGSDTAKIDLSMTEVDVKEFFEDVVEIDEQYSKSIN